MNTGKSRSLNFKRDNHLQEELDIGNGCHLLRSFTSYDLSTKSKPSRPPQVQRRPQDGSLLASLRWLVLIYIIYICLFLNASSTSSELMSNSTTRKTVKSTLLNVHKRPRLSTSVSSNKAAITKRRNNNKQRSLTSRQQTKLQVENSHDDRQRIIGKGFAENNSRTTENGKSACPNCLAIPVLAFLGDKQLNGFLTIKSSLPEQLNKRTKYSDGSSESGKHQTRPQPSSTFTSSEYKNTQISPVHQQYPGRQRNYYNYSQQRNHDHLYKQRQKKNQLKPQMDSSCPMTGPMTICDQVTSYPAEIILNKLENARKVLKSNFFNLDSLFSDESKGSSDPFEEQDENLPSNPTSTPASVATFSYNSSAPTPGANIDAAPPMNNKYYHDLKHPPAKHFEEMYKVHNNHLYQRNQQQPSVAYRQKSTFTYRRTTTLQPLSRDNSRWLNLRKDERQLIGSGNVGKEDFVDLVERQAISISNDPLATLDSHFVDSSNQISEKDKYHHKKQQPIVSILKSSRSANAANGLLLTMDRSSSNSSKGDSSRNLRDSNTAEFERYLSYDNKMALSGQKGLPSLVREGAEIPTDIKQSGEFSTSGANRLLTASGNNRGNSKLTPQSILSFDGRSQLGRHRRQASVGFRTSPASRQSVPKLITANPERIPEVDGMAPQPPEPVCRARTIYISPKAALNVKKQWKYIVNTPELNPEIRQIIRVDICQDPFGPCSERVTIPFGFTSQCKQKYSKKKLLALNAENELLEVDTFFVPSCCVCQLIRDPLIGPKTVEEKDGEEREEDSSLASNVDGGLEKTGTTQRNPSSDRSTTSAITETSDSNSSGADLNEPDSDEAAPTDKEIASSESFQANIATSLAAAAAIASAPSNPVVDDRRDVK